MERVRRCLRWPGGGVAVVLVGLLAAGVLLTAGSAVSSPLTGNGVIAFDNGSFTRIWTIDPTTGTETALTGSGDSSRWPRWSPDGSRITFESKRSGSFQVWVMSADGQGQTQVTASSSGAFDPSFSNDGQDIFYVDGNGAIMEIPADSVDGSESATTILPSGSAAGAAGQPVESPTSDVLAFGGTNGCSQLAGCNVWLLTLGSTTPTPLTSDSGALNYNPAWSADGTQIYFRHLPSGGGTYSVDRVPAAGGAVTTVVGGSDPAPSPDGQQFAYTTGDALHIANTDGSNVVNLPNSTGSNVYEPAWQPAEPPTSNGALTGSAVDPAPGWGAGGSAAPTVDLTAAGNQDWAVWGYSDSGNSTSLAPDVHKAGGSGISSLTDLDPTGLERGGVGHYGSANAMTFSWSDGDPVASDTHAYAGLSHQSTGGSSVGDGYSFTVPADTTTRELKVYVYAHGGVGRLTAHLSDGSAPDYVDQTQKDPSTYNTPAIYTIDYAAASAGQTLTVTWVLASVSNDGNGQYNNAAIYAAALSAPITASTNDSWTNAQEIPLYASDDPSGGEDGSATGSIDQSGEAQWYKFAVTPGGTAQIDLSNLPANYDLSVFSDIGQAYNTLTGTGDLQTLSAESGNDAFSPSVFSPSVFSPSVFSPSVFSPSVFSPSVFSPSVFSPSVFSPSVFSPSVFSPSVFSPSVFSPSVFSPSNPVVNPDAYTGAQTRSLVAISANDGTADEHAYVDIWNNTGYFYIRVNGRNGAYAPGAQPFDVHVHEDAGTCTGVAPSTAALLPSSLTLPTGAGSLFLTDYARLADEPGVQQSDVDALSTKVATFAAGVGGTTFDVDSSPRVHALNAQAAAHPDCAYAENLVASAIRDVVTQYRAASGTNLKSIVIVGDDGVIPFFRYPDTAGLGPESNYSPPVLDGTASQASLQSNDVLSQDAYGATQVIHVKGVDLPIPDLPVGRLVKTPAEIETMLDAYSATNGVVDPSSSLVTGYDFMTSGADAVEANLAAGLGAGATNDTLITNQGVAPGDTGSPPDHSWTADQLRTDLLGSRHDLIFLAGHFSANNTLAADYSTTMNATELADSSVDLENSLVFSAGCHSGYSIVNGDAVPNVTQTLDWSEAFAQKGATLIAGTGYQYGDTDFLAYSEKLYADFSQQLLTGYAGTPVDVGNALVQAKQAYLDATPNLQGIDIKSVLESTLYGLPMLGVDMPHRSPAPTTASDLIVPNPFTGNNPGAQLGLSSVDLHIDTPTSPITTPLVDANGNAAGAATYLTGQDGTESSPGAPTLPLQIKDVGAGSNTVLRGVGFLGGTYGDTTGITPLTGAPATELNGTHSPFVSSAFYPSRLWTVNYFGGLTDGLGAADSTQLDLTPAQYESDASGSTTDRQRAFSHVDLRLFYSGNTQTYGANTPALAAAPTISRVDADSDGAGDVTFTTNVVGDPSAGIQDVWITYTGVDPGTWESFDLTQSTNDSTVWSGTLHGLSNAAIANLQFIVQAVNGVGLVSLDDNQGAYYRPDQIPPALQSAAAALTSTTLTLDSPPSHGAYGTSPTVAATLTAGGTPLANEQVSFSVGGSTQTATTDTNGVASLSLPLIDVPGPYQLTAAFNGDATNAASSGQSTFTIDKLDTTLKLRGDPSVPSAITATLASNGVGLPSRTVAFVLTSGGNPTITQIRTTDFSGQATLGTVPGFIAGQTYTVDAYFESGAPITLPTDDVYGPSTDELQGAGVAAISVTSILRAGSDPTNAKSVAWNVTFSDSVTGVGASNFALVQGAGVSGAKITGVSGSGTSWTVTASTGTGDGTLRLDLTNTIGIAGLGSTATGQAYTVDKTPPTVVVAQATAQPDPTNSLPVAFTATFSEPVSAPAVAAVQVNGSAGHSGATVSISPTGPSTTYTIKVGGLTTDGTVTVSLGAGAATDLAGNASAASSTGADDSVSYDSTPPAVSGAVIATGATPGFMRQGGGYYVYARATDAGSGVATVTADAGSLTTGATAVPLSSGSWLVGGVSYNYRSVLQTANGALAEGPTGFDVTATDQAGNFATALGSVQVDDTPPVTSDNAPSGWHNTQQTVTLSPTDTGGSGVAATYSTTDGSTPNTGSAQGTSIVLSSDGIYTLTYYSVDNVGNSESPKTAANPVKIDMTNPQAPAVSVTGNTYPGTGTTYVRNGVSLSDAATDPSVNGAASGVASVQYLACRGANCTSFAPIGTGGASSPYAFTWSGQPADGPYRVEAKVIDRAGNSSTSTPIAVVVDNTPPATTDNSSTIGNGWKNANQTVTLSPIDTGGSGVAATYFTTDGSTPTTGSAQGLSVPLNGDGLYTVKYFSTDNVGNRESVETAGTQIRIDETPPVAGAVVVPASIRNGQMLTDTTASDPMVNGASSGVATVQYLYCTGSNCTPTAPIGSSATGPGFAVPWTSEPADGPVRVAARVSDAAGNSTTSAAVAVTIDNSAPTTTITGPALGFSNLIGYNGACVPTGICGTAADASGVSLVRVSVQQAATGLWWNGTSFVSSVGELFNGVTPSPLNGVTASWSLPLPLPADGAYNVHVEAVDRLGNDSGASYTSTRSFSIDTTAPSGGSVDATGLVGSGSRYSRTTTLSIAFTKGSDAGSGLAATGARLLRASATLNADGTCGTYSAFSQIGATDPASPSTDNAAGGISTGHCYRYQYSVLDNVGNGTTYSSPDVKVDTVAPTVKSINRIGASPTNASSLSWTVIFSENVNGVAPSNFSLAQTGLPAAGGIAVSGSGTTYTVTASTGTGTGTLGLNLSTVTGVVDPAGNTLAAAFTGQVYTVAAASLAGGTTTCNGAYKGAGANVTVPAAGVCTLVSGTLVTGNITVGAGATLSLQGALVGNDIQATSPASIGITSSVVAHDIHVTGLTGKGPAGGDNFVCGTAVGHDLSFQGGTASAARLVVGGTPDCTAGTIVGHDLVIQSNAEPVVVANNTAVHNVTITGNAPGGATVTSNKAGYDSACSGNSPQAGSKNTGAHSNSCPK